MQNNNKNERERELLKCFNIVLWVFLELSHLSSLVYERVRVYIIYWCTQRIAAIYLLARGERSRIKQFKYTHDVCAETDYYFPGLRFISEWLRYFNHRRRLFGEHKVWLLSFEIFNKFMEQELELMVVDLKPLQQSSIIERSSRSKSTFTHFMWTYWKH